MKTITIEIPENKTLREVEELLAKNGIEIVSHSETEEEYCNMPHIPNAETRKAIEDVEAGIGLTEVKDVNELLLKILG